MVDNCKDCMGCGGCEVVCPVEAVKIKLDNDGFLKMNVNKEKCNNCGMCKKICPINNKSFNKVKKGYAFQSLNEEALTKSASGAFAYESSIISIKEKIPVCSAVYDAKQQRPVHRINTTIKHIEETQNSIYLQSYPAKGFKEIINKKSGVIIGSPCQIATIDNILKQKKLRKNYLLIDFFCHGVPSYNLWKKYLVYKKCSNHKAVEFRSKKYGWGNYTIKIENNYNTIYSDKNIDKDIFFRVFLEDMALNECCHKCDFHGEHSCADVRMGDFWASNFKHDSKGRSALLAYSDAGVNMIEKLKNAAKIDEVSVENVLEGQLSDDIKIPSCRKSLLKALKGKRSLKNINNTNILAYKFKRKITGKR